MAEYIYTMVRARKAVGEKLILDDVTMSFLPGAKIGMVGPNGAGKSTIIKIMAGLDHPSNGEAKLTPGFSVGILMQEPVLDESKTVLENIEDGVAIKAKVDRFNEISGLMSDPDADFDALFTRDKPVIFAYHGYPWLIHRLTYRRTNHDNFHVRGYKEEGTTTTPFDMTVLNQLDRFDLALDVIDRVPGLRDRGGAAHEWLRNRLIEHSHYVRRHGEDLPDVSDWQWGSGDGPQRHTPDPSRNTPEG